ncbi:hypothetical protein ACCS72_38355, partial [Rhizobium ruizarguesonis]
LRPVTQRRRSLARLGAQEAFYLHLFFALSGSPRAKMIVKLYTGRYSPDVRDIATVAVSIPLLLRPFVRPLPLFSRCFPARP